MAASNVRLSSFFPGLHQDQNKQLEIKQVGGILSGLRTFSSLLLNCKVCLMIVLRGTYLCDKTLSLYFGSFEIVKDFIQTLQLYSN